MDRIALLEAAQDGDRVDHGRLIDQDFLEAPLKSCVLLDIFTIFIERRCADAMQLTAGKRRFEHIAGIHGALCLSGADHRVQLIDEKNDLAFLLGEITQYTLEALLEFSAEFSAGDQRAHIERENTLVLQALGHLAVDDALRQAFHDGGLAHARFTNEDRIVLGSTLEHLNRPANFVITTDHRIQLSAAGTLREVNGVLLQRAARLLGIRIIDGRTTAHFVDGLLDGCFLSTRFLDGPSEFATIFKRRERKQLRGDKLVPTLLRRLIAGVQQPGQVIRHVHIRAIALDLRQTLDGVRQSSTQL